MSRADTNLSRASARMILDLAEEGQNHHNAQYLAMIRAFRIELIFKRQRYLEGTDPKVLVNRMIEVRMTLRTWGINI